MTKDEAIRTLALHLMQCGAMMPIDWVTTHGEGSQFMEAYKMAMDALKEKDALTPVTNADRIRAMSDEELANWVVCPHLDGQGCMEYEGCIQCCLKWLQTPAREA